jgi:hypothetical protein
VKLHKLYRVLVLSGLTLGLTHCGPEPDPNPNPSPNPNQNILPDGGTPDAGTPDGGSGGGPAGW